MNSTSHWSGLSSSIEGVIEALPTLDDLAQHLPAPSTILQWMSRLDVQIALLTLLAVFCIVILIRAVFKIVRLIRDDDDQPQGTSDEAADGQLAPAKLVQSTARPRSGPGLWQGSWLLTTTRRCLGWLLSLLLRLAVTKAALVRHGLCRMRTPSR